MLKKAFVCTLIVLTFKIELIFYKKKYSHINDYLLLWIKSEEEKLQVLLISIICIFKSNVIEVKNLMQIWWTMNMPFTVAEFASAIIFFFFVLWKGQT